MSDGPPGLPFQGHPQQSPGVGSSVGKADTVPGALLREATGPKRVQAASRVSVACLAAVWPVPDPVGCYRSLLRRPAAQHPLLCVNYNSVS